MGSNFRSYSNSTPDLTDKDFGPTGGMLNKSPVKPENQEVNTQNLVDGLTSDADFYSSHCLTFQKLLAVLALLTGDFNGIFGGF